MNAQPDLSRHPCFNEEAKGVCGRVHLPVAPKCNIKCNYCDRKYDCVNESRPGVSSAILKPKQAALYMHGVLAKEPSISVVGIAGPGDPLANPEETFGTLREIRKAFPEMLFCLSTNGLALPEYVDELVELNVSHVTVTVNAIDTGIGEKIYAWVRVGKVIYRGLRAAEVLLERQIEGIKMLKAKGMIVKVNTILIPSVNEDHVEAVAREMGELGVDVLNVMPMVPNAGTPFGGLHEPGHDEVSRVRGLAEVHLPQMKHCQRCRADAVGLLEEDRSGEFAELLADCSASLLLQTEGKPYVAVASREGLLVNQHLGEADSFQIWGQVGETYKLIAEREAPPKGGGVERWRELAKILRDCRAVLASGFGNIPEGVLRSEGIVTLEMSGFVEMALGAVFAGKDFEVVKRRRTSSCDKGLGCSGDGGGCG